MQSINRHKQEDKNNHIMLYLFYVSFSMTYLIK